MPNIQPFEDYSDEYDEWFDKNRDKYDLELRAIAGFIPSACFDYVLMVATICFVDDLHRSFAEA